VRTRSWSARSATFASVCCLSAGLTASGFGGHATAAPNPQESPNAGVITARSYVAIDAATGRVLVEKRARERAPIASLTKVMTALVVIERGGLDRKIRVTPEAVNVEDFREGLVAGRWYRRELLLWSSLLQSANDSATALAIDAGDGSLKAFYRSMNEKATALGLQDTTYASASGLEDDLNQSTALDQALLARAALKNPIFARMVATRVYRTKWPPPTYAKEWVNHNKMLSTSPGTYGVKTGWTTKAQGCLIIAQRRGGRDVIGVILGSARIWDDMAAVLSLA
jgi:serine-type D-Ala-D-Ala carboxypeptidase (penicillin-binding protein 5/6)